MSRLSQLKTLISSLPPTPLRPAGSPQLTAALQSIAGRMDSRATGPNAEKGEAALKAMQASLERISSGQALQQVSWGSLASGSILGSGRLWHMAASMERRDLLVKSSRAGHTGRTGADLYRSILYHPEHYHQRTIRSTTHESRMVFIEQRRVKAGAGGRAFSRSRATHKPISGWRRVVTCVR